VIISHAKRFVVLATWKAASSTIRVRLGTYCESPYSAFYHRSPVLGRVVHRHLTLDDFAALPESQMGYVTAAFVRNPYDRVYAGFRQLQTDIHEQPLAEFPDDAVRTLVMEQLAANQSQLRRACFEFEPWLALIDDRQVLEAGANSSFPLHPAHYWTHRDGVQAVDFVGRVESFEHDFGRLCRVLGVAPSSRANANVGSSDMRLAGGRHGYRYAERISRGARRRIEELFAADFELFGYPRAGTGATSLPPRSRRATESVRHRPATADARPRA
jgi:hypothetical protein